MTELQSTPVITALVAVIHQLDDANIVWIASIKPAMTVRDMSGGYL